MTDPVVAPGRRSRARWAIAIPSLLLLVLAAGWSAFWFVAARRADDAIEAWLRREAEHGRVYACANRQLTGFPFRAELICDRPSAQLPGENGPVVLTGQRFVAVAQVYDPSRMIAELTGPVEAEAADGRKGELSFALAQASMGLSGRRFDRASIALDAPRLTSGADEIVAAEAMQVHLRRAPGAPEGSYDVALKIDGAASPFLDLAPVGSGPLSVELQAEARGLDDLRPRPTSERLRDFAAAGGRVHVVLARVARGDVAAEGRGDLALDTEGRIEGAGDVVARGVDGVVQELVAGGKKTAIASLLGVGAQLLGAQTTLDGQRATSYRVTIEKGKVAIGPIRVYKLPPVF
jgi:hypothetical protein